MDVKELQQLVITAGEDPGPVDGVMGIKTKAAVKRALVAKSLTQTPDFDTAEQRTGIDKPILVAVSSVESGGQGIDPVTGLPIIRFEPHIFRRETGGRFDDEYPLLSGGYSRNQPRLQRDRWDQQLLNAMALDPDAAIRATSWGGWQVMGFNAVACGFKKLVGNQYVADEWRFARAHAESVQSQFEAFIHLLTDWHLVPVLKAKRWAEFARRYNGPAYADNHYDTRLAQAYARAGGR